MRKIIERVKALGLPSDGFAVTGGGVLAAHGIRDTKDIDLLVTPELYVKLQQSGWELKQFRPDYCALVKDEFEASPLINSYHGYQPDIFGLISRADVIEGIPFLQLSDVVAFKQANGRPKDIEDIKLVLAYLENKNLKNAR